MLRAIDPLTRKTYPVGRSQARREVERGYLFPLATLVPDAPGAAHLFVAIRRGPACGPRELAEILTRAVAWWRDGLEGRAAALTASPQVGHTYPRPARRPRRVAHSWGPSIVGAAEDFTRIGRLSRDGGDAEAPV